MDHNFPFVPPLNFELVAKGGIYRSGHPNERNFSFLRSLKLKSIMYLGLEDLRPNMSGFCEEEGIQVFHIRLQLNKEPFDEMDEDEVAAALSLILDKRNLPMLVHCNKGKYRVGCIVGCLRKFQGWMQSAIFDEYSRLAGVKVADQEFIEVFDTSKIKVDPAYMLELT
ncbi:protein-tyrosine phosphatase [Tilletiaria anomala UBC 951]|uniref:Protein-tyrosine phosphatase n=1 Tax=Tilletiaria anomala (strain ATCC 24038 / CBS 436.72 / UBC 951) TaxID=1037660 RepID=A0A066WJK1_TILAU|nr:protein-tyrosine phosphatase [Tilletiaria anomala UBC 951]KDN50820.1 protein-tyrosine phosphatase [Tilletiaria anomala UBC 951]